MKKFSEKIKESQETKTYKYVVTATIEGTVTASSDSEAGELVDKEMDEISSITDYQMDQLDATNEKPEINENLVDPSENMDGLVASCMKEIHKYMGQIQNYTELSIFREKITGAIDTYVESFVI